MPHCARICGERLHQLGRGCGGSAGDCAPEDNAPENDAAACEAACAAAVAAADEGSSAAVDCLLLSSVFAMSAATGCAAGADEEFGRVSSLHFAVVSSLHSQFIVPQASRRQHRVRVRSGSQRALESTAKTARDS